MKRDETADPDKLLRPEGNDLASNYSLHDIAESYFRGRAEQMGLCAEQWGIDMRHDDESIVYDDKMDLRLWEARDGQEYAPDAPDDFRGAEYHERLADPDMSYRRVEERGMDPHDLNEQRWSLRSVVDIKSKANPDWLGILNLRHLAHYATHAAAYDVPVCLYFTMVDEAAETVGEESVSSGDSKRGASETAVSDSNNIIVPVTTDWEYEEINAHYDTDSPLQLDGEVLNELARECQIVNRVFRAPDNNMVVATDETFHEDFDWFEDQL